MCKSVEFWARKGGAGWEDIFNKLLIGCKMMDARFDSKGRETCVGHMLAERTSEKSTREGSLVQREAP